jgi:hypothetical protein
MKAVIAIAGCKNSGKSSLCRYLTYLVARVDGLIINDKLAGSFDNRLLAQVSKDASQKVYITDNGRNYIEAKLKKDPNVETLSFAGPIKEFCVNVLNLEYESVYGTDDQKNSVTQYVWENMPSGIRGECGFEKSGSMTSREIMQVLGTDIFRNYFSQSIWIDCLINKVKKSDADVIFVDDLRFNNEASALMKEDAMIVHLQRMWGQGGSHKSENGLDLSLFTGYPHFYSIPDVDIMSKNDIAFRATRKYFEYVIRKQDELSEQVQTQTA